MSDYIYQGSELDVFKHAVNWKRYYASQITPYISGDVLEVGAGIGGTTKFLSACPHRSWTCLEPDAALADRLEQQLTGASGNGTTKLARGTVADLAPEQRFDTILYIDVLEHIEDDASELNRVAGHLRANGHVIVLSPAHRWLMSPFDHAVGHYRRYTVSSLSAVSPSSLRVVRMFYLDCMGMVTSFANRALLRNQHPTLSQVQLWDSVIVPMSRILDPLSGRRLGKTVIGIWTRAEQAERAPR